MAASSFTSKPKQDIMCRIKHRPSDEKEHVCHCPQQNRNRGRPLIFTYIYSRSCVLSYHWCLKQILQFAAKPLCCKSPTQVHGVLLGIFSVLFLSKLMTSVLILIWRVYRHSCRADTTFSFGMASIFLPAWPSKGEGRGGTVWLRFEKSSFLKTALLYVYNRSKRL